jgi:hypothetical protein
MAVSFTKDLLGRKVESFLAYYTHMGKRSSTNGDEGKVETDFDTDYTDCTDEKL